MSRDTLALVLILVAIATVASIMPFVVFYYELVLVVAFLMVMLSLLLMRIVNPE